MPAAVVAGALLGVGPALGLAGPAVPAACPVAAHAVVPAGYRLAHGGRARLRSAARRHRR